MCEHCSAIFCTDEECRKKRGRDLKCRARDVQEVAGSSPVRLTI